VPNWLKRLNVNYDQTPEPYRFLICMGFVSPFALLIGIESPITRGVAIVYVTLLITVRLWHLGWFTLTRPAEQEEEQEP
jgi:hypothetical protein